MRKTNLRQRAIILCFFHLSLAWTFAQVPTTIDVLVLYSGFAKTEANSIGLNIENLIKNDGVSNANEAFSNSNTIQRIRLVHLEEAPLLFFETGSCNQSVLKLQNPNDPHFSYVHGLRTLYGADIVVLVTNDADLAGCVYEVCGSNFPCDATFEDKAFAVVVWEWLTWEVLAHELGHVMGLMHGREAVIGCPNNCFQGAAPDGYGYKDTPGTAHPACWSTIMSNYMVSSSCGDGEGFHTRMRYFSNPAINHPTRGVPLGIDHAVNPANSANNARVLREATRNVVARWRDNSLSGLSFTYNGPFPSSAKAVVDIEDGDLHLKGGATIGSTFAGLRFSYNGVPLASVGQDGNALAADFLENQTAHPSNSLRFINATGLVLGSVGTDGRIRTNAVVDINSIP